MKKHLMIAITLLTIIVGTIGFTDTVNAQVSYDTPWGKMYRTPEYSSSYGRAWYNLASNGTYGYIYLESFYTYGCGVSLEFKYATTNKKYQATSKSSSCRLEKSVSKAKGVTVSGNAYNLKFSKYIKA